MVKKTGPTTFKKVLFSKSKVPTRQVNILVEAPLSPKTPGPSRKSIRPTQLPPITPYKDHPYHYVSLTVPTNDPLLLSERLFGKRQLLRIIEVGEGETATTIIIPPKST